jgi:hypothetical protein
MLIQTLNLNLKTKTLKGESMNRWIVWTITLLIFLDYDVLQVPS